MQTFLPDPRRFGFLKLNCTSDIDFLFVQRQVKLKTEKFHIDRCQYLVDTRFFYVEFYDVELLKNTSTDHNNVHLQERQKPERQRLNIFMKKFPDYNGHVFEVVKSPFSNNTGNSYAVTKKYTNKKQCRYIFHVWDYFLYNVSDFLITTFCPLHASQIDQFPYNIMVKLQNDLNVYVAMAIS